MTAGLLKPRLASADQALTLPALLRHSVARKPHGLAILTVDEALTYAELDSRIADFAAALVSRGAGKGSRIGLIAPDGIVFVTAFMASVRIGAIVVAISTLATAPELAHIIAHSDVQILVGVRRFLRHDYGQRLEAAFPDLGKSAADEELYLRGAPYLRSIWLDDAEGLAWARPWSALRGSHGPSRAHLDAMEREVVPSDDALIIYTSGSSSLPKAVLHSHRSSAQQSLVMAQKFRIHTGQRLMPLLPAFWVGGMSMMLQLLGSAATIVYPKSPAMDDIVDAVRQLAVERINSWGPQVDKVRAALAEGGIDPDVIGGLGPARTAQGEIIPRGRTSNMLGMTESFGPHSAEPIDVMLAPDHEGSSGRATSDYERRIVDPVTGAVLGPGEVGELQLRRGGLLRGIYKADPDTVFTPDGFFPTGDRARIEADGHLYFEGRKSDMIKTAGANVSRQEVEAALRELDMVALPIVVPLPHVSAGQIVVAAVVASKGANITEDELKQALRDRIASYKVPRRIILIGEHEVPWTPSHKIKAEAIALLIADRIGHDPHGDAP